jgi:hypothetical protein
MNAVKSRTAIVVFRTLGLMLAVALLALGAAGYLWRDLLTWPPPRPSAELMVITERGVDPDDRALITQLDRQLPQLELDGATLTDVIDFLRDVSSANIYVNWRSLEGAGVKRDAPVFCKLRNVGFARALDVVLDSVAPANVRLGYTVDDGVIMVSTLDDLRLDTSTHVYDVRDLLAGNPTTTSADYAAALRRLHDRITAEVDPESWQAGSGKSGLVREMGGQLIVTQSATNHVAVTFTLARLRWRRQIGKFGRKAMSLIVPAAAAAGVLRLGFHVRRNRRRRRRGLCVQCGYDLRASGHCCPECGTRVASRESALLRHAEPGA